MLSPLHLFASPIALGTRLPEITVTTHADEKLDLAKAGEKGFLLVYFYPKADTPGCTAQACSLRDAYAQLTDKGIRVVGVSMDSVGDQKKFHDKYELPFPLIADADGATVKAFGVPAAGSFAKRQAFLFKDGVLVWHDASASTGKQAADVLAVVGTL